MAFWLFSFLLFNLLFPYQPSTAELITALPGQPANVGFKQHSGYIVTDALNGRALFYYFVEAEAADPLSLPLTLWLNGGPGCSSVGFGAFMEHGPFQPGPTGQLFKNKHSWNLASNMLYVESPIGVGFSYSNTSSDYKLWNDTTTADDNLKFIVNWLEEFPQYKNSDFFITGESYAGHYVPQLATSIMEYNNQPYVSPINLKAIAIGNPLLDIDISVLSGTYLWAHGAISDEVLLLEQTMCNDSDYLRLLIHGEMSEECNYVFDRVTAEVGDIDPSDLLLPYCTASSSTNQLKLMGKRGEIHAKMSKKSVSTTGNPCITDWIFSYLNNPRVQKAIYANTTNLPYYWDFCGGPLEYQQENLEINILPLLSNLIQEGIPITLFSGDQDTKIPLTQTRTLAYTLAKDLKLVPLTSYANWFNKKQVGGWSQSFGLKKEGENVTYLTYATVRGAAHEVPFTSPSQALTLFKSFLSGSPLPGQPDN